MKKFFAILTLLLLICTPLFAAAATSTTTEYGFSVTGDTGAVVVNSGDTFVKAFIFYPSTSTDTAIITTGTSNVTFTKMSNTNGYIGLGDNGARFKNITVTLTAGTDYLAIVTR